MANPTASPGRANLDYLQEHTHLLTLRQQYLLHSLLLGTLAAVIDPAVWREAVASAMERLDRLYPRSDKSAEEAQKAGAA